MTTLADWRSNFVEVTVDAAATLPTWLNNVTAGTWSSIITVNNQSTVNGISHPNYSGQTAPRNIFVPWSSGLWDPVRKRMGITGGGHNDSSDNSWVIWDGIDDVPDGFSLLRVPTSPPISGASGSDMVSVHTYEGLVYEPNVDRYLRFGGATYPSGAGTNQVWSVHPTTGVGTLMASIPAAADLELQDVAVYDSGSQRVIFRGDTAAAPYNAGADTWGTAVTGLTQLTGGSSNIAAVDPVRRLLFIYRNGRTHFLYDIDSSGNISNERTPTYSLSLDGGTEAGGVVYDPTNEEFILYTDNGTIYTLDPGVNPETQWTATQRDTGGPGELDASYQGHFGRFQLDDDWRTLFFVADEADTMHVHRIDW